MSLISDDPFGTEATSIVDASFTDASFTEAISSDTAVLTLTGLPSQPATPALTTVFTPPSSCLASIYSPSPAGSDFVTIGNVIDFTRGYVDTCYPSGYSSLEGQFSPGICPSGYTGLGTAIGPVSTIITCCPSSFSNYITDGGSYSCMHYNASASVLSSSQTVGYSGVNLYALPIIVALEVTDLPVLAAASTAAPAQSVGSQSAPTSDSSSFSSSPHSGLSTGAKAGIGVGVALGVILLTLGCLLLLRRRRKAKTLANGLNDGFTGEKAELPSESRQMAELDTDRREPEMDVDGARHEVDGVAKSGELDGTNAKGRAELDGGWRGEEAPVVQHLPKRDENYV